METARILAGLETDTDICFLFFSGEEDGLYGSLRFTESLEEEYRSRIVGQIHIEQARLREKCSLGAADSGRGRKSSGGNLLRQEGLTEEEQAESEIQEEGSLAETEASGERNSWEYRRMMPPASGIWLRRGSGRWTVIRIRSCQNWRRMRSPDGKAAGDYGYSGYDGRQNHEPGQRLSPWLKTEGKDFPENGKCDK